MFFLYIRRKESNPSILLRDITQKGRFSTKAFVNQSELDDCYRKLLVMMLVPSLLTSCSDLTANSCTVFAMFLETVTQSAVSTTATFNSLKKEHNNLKNKPNFAHNQPNKALFIQRVSQKRRTCAKLYWNKSLIYLSADIFVFIYFF